MMKKLGFALALVALGVLPLWAQTTIRGMPDASSMAAGDGFMVDQGTVPSAVTREATLQQIMDFIEANGVFTENNHNSGTNASSSTFLRGDNTWATPVGASTQYVSVPVRKGSAGTITAGSPVYISGYNASGWIEVEAADADNASAMPAVAVASVDITNAATVDAYSSGEITGLATDSWSVGDELWVSTTAGVLTSTKPTGASAAIQKIAQVTRSHASAGVIQVFGAGRSNDVPNITDGSLWVGNASDVATAVAPSGDATMTNAGVFSVSDLTISSEAHGDILFRNATNWVRLAADTAGYYLQTGGAGADPNWGLPVTDVWNCGGGDCQAIAMGASDALNAGAALSVELPNSATPTTDAAGEIALDTTITDHQPLWQYYDGGENMTIIAIDTSELPALDNEIVKYDAASDKFVLEADAGGGGGMPVKEVYFAATALKPGMAPDDSFPASVHEEGTNIDMDVLAYDDTTDECAGGTFQVPSDVDTSGTVTFRIRWYSGTATANDAMFDFRWHDVSDNDSWDAALTTEEAGAVTTAGSVDLITMDTWTETLATLAWAASDTIEFLLCRDADSTGTGTDNLVGDANVVDFAIEIPRS